LSIYERAAVGLSLFLVLTPGFGVQYTAILGPVLLAASLTWGLWWALLSGLFIGTVYAAFWTGGWPLHSEFTGTFPVPAAAVGVAAWALLVVFTIATLRRRSPVP
jgi:MYXO-CTERM domain-containing protein